MRRLYRGQYSSSSSHACGPLVTKTLLSCKPVYKWTELNTRHAFPNPKPPWPLSAHASWFFALMPCVARLSNPLHRSLFSVRSWLFVHTSSPMPLWSSSMLFRSCLFANRSCPFARLFARFFAVLFRSLRRCLLLAFDV